ncbi:hypothetical protein JKF63_02921 [Porcisia hertigi]|uniref:NadR/Ttd14 AAA domain-containing protein n=1 Tax=Porcisia hertigi TaxID=2761500 RepID=A0A836L886_9TRYP|nr:hypothetical protein JKF63_02921 [Porcisia hertigi]
MPLTSEELVEALPATATPTAGADAAVAAPAPPTTQHTSNPRQLLTGTLDARLHPHPFPYPEETSVPATRLPAKVSTAPLAVIEVAGKRPHKERRVTKTSHLAPTSRHTRTERGHRDGAGAATTTHSGYAHRGSRADAGAATDLSLDGNGDAIFFGDSPREGLPSACLHSEGGPYGKRGNAQIAASAKSSPSPDAPPEAETTAASCASVKTIAIADDPDTSAARLVQLSSALAAYRPVARSASPGPALRQYEGLALTSVQEVLESKHQVYRICLTGGPCAGKSTLLSAIQAKIPQRTGFRVMCVPEAATLLVTGGMQWDPSLVVPQQLGLLRTQLALEDQFYALAAASSVPTIIVSDRGTMDGRAFCTDAQFEEILRSVGSTLDVLRDRYDAVIHMVTAADGAEEFYNLDNPARYEGLDGARASDRRLQEMYVGHPMFRLLDNSTTFEDKIERGLQVVSQVVHKEQCAPALPTHYLVRSCPDELPVSCAVYTTYTTVLGNSHMGDIRLLVKREMPDGSTMHFFKSVCDSPPPGATAAAAAASSRASPRAASHTSCSTSLRYSLNSHSVSTAAPMQQRVERAQRISSREYTSLCKHRDHTRADVVMRATHFIYEGSNYELTTLIAPSWAAGRRTLTVESCTVPTMHPRHDNVCEARNAVAPVTALFFPPFLEVDREVPVESLTTAFLISHRETGPLYTSLAFAPVFSRSVVTAIGAHADTENILNSTLSTSRGPSALPPEKCALFTYPVDVGEEEGENKVAPTTALVLDHGRTLAEDAEHVMQPDVPPPLPPPKRRGLAPLTINTITSPAHASKSVTVKTEGARSSAPGLSPPPHDASTSVDKKNNSVTPSSLLGVGGETSAAEAAPAASAGGPLQPERVMVRDLESILPPIGMKKLTPIAGLGN